MAPIRIPLIVVAALFAGACASTSLTVRKVELGDTKTAGLRYSLPRPFVLIVPNQIGDGGFATEVVYLPDECQTYAIDARTKFGKYQLDMTVKDGMLSKVVWNQKDSQATTVEGIRASGEILKGELERREKEKGEAAKKSQDAIKAAEEAVEKAATELASKQLEVELAEAKVASAQAGVAEDPSVTTRAALREAQLLLQQAIIRRDRAARDVELAKTELEEIPQDNPGAAKPAVAEMEAVPEFWGPVLYEVVDTGTSVELVAVDWRDKHQELKCGQKAAAAAQKQLPFKTAKAPKTVEEAVAPKLKNQPNLSLTWPSTGTLELTLDMDAQFDSLALEQRSIRRLQPDPPAVLARTLYNAIPNSERRSVKVVFAERLAAGKYQLTIPFVYAETKQGSITIEITVEAVK